MGYQIDEAVSGRVHAAKVKLQSNDLPGAESMIQRVLKMMERDSGIGAGTEKPTISLGELNSRILYILELNNIIHNTKLRTLNHRFLILLGC